MAKVVGFSLVGFIVGFSAVFVACQFAITLPPFKERIEAAQSQSAGNSNYYEEWYEQKVLSRVLIASFFGGLLCGGFGGLRATQDRRLSNNAFRRSRRPWAKHDEWPLSQPEFARVLQCCLFTQVENREPIYIQGVIVGRLVDSDPELARKVDEFSSEHMLALWRDLRRAACLG
jgi:hypothetical protein